MSRQILSWQSKFYKFLQTYLLALMFSISVLKSNQWSYWKWQTFKEKIFAIFYNVKKYIYFPYNSFVFIFIF